MCGAHEAPSTRHLLQLYSLRRCQKGKHECSSVARVSHTATWSCGPTCVSSSCPGVLRVRPATQQLVRLVPAGHSMTAHGSGPTPKERRKRDHFGAIVRAIACTHPSSLSRGSTMVFLQLDSFVASLHQQCCCRLDAAFVVKKGEDRKGRFGSLWQPAKRCSAKLYSKLKVCPIVPGWCCRTHLYETSSRSPAPCRSSRTRVGEGTLAC